MNILDLQRQYGGSPVHASGDEWHDSCADCGGHDRFSSWPNKVNSNGRYMGGRFVCRGCGASGDAVNFLMKRRGLSYMQACKYLQIDPGQMPERTTRQVWTPEPAKALPLELWQDKARAFMVHCSEQLERNTEALSWLQEERGLTMETISASRLGWNAKDLFLDREEWGLPSEISQKTGQQKKLWIAAGLTIPFCLAKSVVRLRVRRSKSPEKGSRYILVSGSFTGAMTLWQDQQAVAIVESELDGLLVSQEAGDLIGTIGLGSAALKPDSELHERLMKAKTVLCSLDSDAPGAKAVRFWRQYPGYRRWMAIRGKDVTEQWKAGIEVRTWVQAGLTN